MFNKGKYRFQILEPNNILLHEERFFLKVNALNCLAWHTKFNTRLKYRLINIKTGEEVTKDITYTLLKGNNV